MIEDMYKEEIGDIEQDSNSSSDNAPRRKGKMASSGQQGGPEKFYTSGL